MMNDQSLLWNRLATIILLIEKSPPNVRFGHTAIMKLIYFLQILKLVPLEYDFDLYTYGPYDSEVLNDLKIAERLGAVKSTCVLYPNGYGYELTLGDENIKAEIFQNVNSLYKEEIEWIISEFGKRNSSELELLSTIVFADRDYCLEGAETSIDEIAKKVHEIKPHFSVDQISFELMNLKEKGLINSCQ